MRSGSPFFEDEQEVSLSGPDDELDYESDIKFAMRMEKEDSERNKEHQEILREFFDEREKKEHEENAEKNLKAIQALIEQRAQLEQQDKTAPKIAELTVYINWLAEKAKKHGITAIVEIAAKAESARQQDKFKFLAAPQKSPGAGGQVSAPTLGKV